MGRVSAGSHNSAGDNEAGGAGNSPGKPGTTASPSSTPDPHRLACPFFKRDPRRHDKLRSCTGPGWKTVHRVKYETLSPLCPRQQLTAPQESTSTDSTRQRYTAIVVVSLSPGTPSLQPILELLKYAAFKSSKSPMASTRTKNGCLNESGNMMARKQTSGRKYTRSCFQMRKTFRPHVSIFLRTWVLSHLRLD